MTVQLVTIEGNIGTGKSTLASHVAQYMPTMRFMAAPEPEENPHWAAFIASPTQPGLALTMQCWLLRARARVYLRALRHIEEARESVILDFSIWSDLIFATKHHEDGLLSAAEFERYQQLAREIYALQLPPPHLSIVLQATPEICLQRRSTPQVPRPTRLPRAAQSARAERPRHLECRREACVGRFGACPKSPISTCILSLVIQETTGPQHSSVKSNPSPTQAVPKQRQAHAQAGPGTPPQTGRAVRAAVAARVTQGLQAQVAIAEYYSQVLPYPDHSQ